MTTRSSSTPPPRVGPKTRDYRGGQPLNIDTIGDALVIKEGDVFLFTDESGEIRPEARAGFGLYSQDTRYLSEYRLYLQWQEPIVLLSTAESGYSSEQVLTNRRTRAREGQLIPPQTLQVRRTRVIDNGLAERIEVTNHGRDAVVVDLALRFDVDFADIFAVRGVHAPLLGQHEEPVVSKDSARWSYRSLDGRLFTTEFSSSELPASISENEARYQIALEPQGTREFEVRFAVNDRQRPESAPALLRIRNSYEEWRRRDTQVTSDNHFFQQALDRSFDDIRMLVRRPPESDGDLLVSAGTPWFDALFGRDSIITSLQMLPYRPEIARGTLRLLAKYQGAQVEPSREEQPGRILHERRGGELARTHQVPFGNYFGSIDSTPLFLVLFAEYMTWTNDHALAQELAPNVEAALRWIDEYGDKDGDGYIEYATSFTNSLENQGWKDSMEGIPDEQGNPLQTPIALVEAQSYVYAAYTGLAGMYRNLGDKARAESLQARAESLQRRFLKDFWLAEERFLALALDGEKKPSHAIASNAGHALWAGIMAHPHADVLARRLFAPDMFTGWGIRTLSSQSPAYNPMGYHIGTIWPHDNSLIAMGLKRFHHDDLLVTLTTALFDVARSSQYYRLPELFCGHTRIEHSPPVPYPVACRPQAWAAGALPYMLQALMGLRPDAANKRLMLVRPTLPPWLTSVLLENLRVGEGSVNLLIQRHFDRPEVRIIGAKNVTVEVVSEWPGD